MAKIYFYQLPELWRKEDKYAFLQEKQDISHIEWQVITPDKNYTWLTEGLHTEFENFIPIGTKEGKAAKGEGENVLFKIYGGGVKTNRDAWAYNFSYDSLIANMQKIIENYNTYVLKWMTRGNDAQVDSFISYDSNYISWDSTLKNHLTMGKKAEFSEEKVRISLYRPFVKKFLFFDRTMNNSVHRFHQFFPTPTTENENQVMGITGLGSEKPFSVLIFSMIPDLNMISPGAGGTQCFPFYTYSEDGAHRQENLTNWAFKHFRTHYQDSTITKWAIFYYVYALLHHPHYREKYAANLKKELPRIPLAPDFWKFSRAGERLAELHLDYEKQPEYPLKKVVTPGQRPDYRVEKMRLTKEKDALIYNETLTLKGIPPEAFQYRLGHRSALEWVVDQYQVKIDGHSGSRDQLEWFSEYQAKTTKGSGILNDPNRLDDPQYILRLIGQVITVSIETVKIVKGLPMIEEK